MNGVLVGFFAILFLYIGRVIAAHRFFALLFPTAMIILGIAAAFSEFEVAESDGVKMAGAALQEQISQYRDSEK